VDGTVGVAIGVKGNDEEMEAMQWLLEIITKEHTTSRSS